MYKSLQAGRAVAALSVLLFHLGGAISDSKYFAIQEFTIPFGWGGAGVQFFFVLSGFIIFTAHHTDISKPKMLLNYLKKRAIRIYPAYLIIFSCVFLIALLFSQTRSTLPHNIFVIIKSLLLVPQDASIVGGTGAPVIVVAWTLQYEMLFYLFFGLMILNKYLSTLVGIVWLFLFIVHSGSKFPITFVANSNILLFAMGMAVAKFHKQKMFSYKFIYAICLKVGVVWFSYLSILHILKVNVEFDNILQYGIASTLIIYGLIGLEDNGRAIGENKYIQLVGDSSYVLYLIHFPLISIVLKISMFIQIGRFGAVGAIITYLFILILCLVVAIVFHLKIERPIMRYLRR